MTIGERLEEARKRKGVSVREAAEATKIGGDFLLAMENNSFDIDLPEVYIRGFLKNYGKFLKMDADKLLVDYEAFRNHKKKAKRASQNASLHESHHADSDVGEVQTSLGRMDLGSDSTDDADALGVEEVNESMRDRGGPDYVRLGIIIGGSVLGVCLLIFVVSLFFGGDDPATGPAHANAAPANVTSSTNSDESGAINRPVTLIASDRVTIVVDQKNDKKVLYQGTLERGERKTLEAYGPVLIRYTKGSALLVERAGQRFSMSKPSVGINTLN